MGTTVLYVHNIYGATVQRFSHTLYSGTSDKDTLNKGHLCIEDTFQHTNLYTVEPLIKDTLNKGHFPMHQPIYSGTSDKGHSE